jgi:hypothetical protein
VQNLLVAIDRLQALFTIFPWSEAIFSVRLEFHAIQAGRRLVALSRIARSSVGFFRALAPRP